MLDLVSSTLKRDGFSVTTSSNPLDALRLLCEDATVDLLVTDYNMPQMKGDQLVREALKARPSLAFVVISSDPGIHAGFRRGDAVLKKPFNPSFLGDVARQAIEQSRSDSKR